MRVLGFFPFLGISETELARASADVAHFLGHSAEVAQGCDGTWGLPPPSLQLKAGGTGRWVGKEGREVRARLSSDSVPVLYSR